MKSVFRGEPYVFTFHRKKQNKTKQNKTSNHQGTTKSRNSNTIFKTITWNNKFRGIKNRSDTALDSLSNQSTF